MPTVRNIQAASVQGLTQRAQAASTRPSMRAATAKAKAMSVMSSHGVVTKAMSTVAAAAVAIDASDLNADLHASAAYRANLISVQTQRAVAKMTGA